MGRSPRDVVVANLTGDGIPDLVVANYNDDTVSVLDRQGRRHLPTPGGFCGRRKAVFARGRRLERRWQARHRRRQLRQRHGERAFELRRNQQLREFRAADDVPHRQTAIFSGSCRPDRKRRTRHHHRQRRKQYRQRAHGQRQRHVPTGANLRRRLPALFGRRRRLDRRRRARHRHRPTTAATA